ncbi:PEPxxWA-CTERM sorting domain-containing protein [Qipengyuania sediminis]|uniref:PEPxxWA-CTERM sorting domain-containing protein n=1 Tax=Qipengyuania sediminis TaxID=1532023 RepID=UPI0010599179|nr:PEPxxWA-CTERM sorting domain-containing protein [Qipengyuania sediminis]
MFKHAFLAAGAAAALFAVPGSAATVVFPGTSPSPAGVITLNPAGPNEVSGFLGFDVVGTGEFFATLTFINPFANATAGGSAVFNFDGDVITFTGGDISGAGTASTSQSALGSSIQVDRVNLAAGSQTFNIRGTLNPSGGNGFARVGGQLSLQATQAIPEPGTWALFILGFGAIGGALRRRTGAVRVSKAKLHFA